MKTMVTRIIVLDDSMFDNSLCMLYFKRLLHHIEFDIVGFTDPKEGLRYMETEFCCQPVRTILLLDISMPVLNGWDVLEKLERLPAHITKFLSVYILSYSIHKDDVQRSEESPLVKAYLAKPLTDHLSYLFEMILEGELTTDDGDNTSSFYTKE